MEFGHHYLPQAGGTGQIVLNKLYFRTKGQRMSKNKFGGNWTELKISILETYTKQFLTVFKNKPNQKLLYFDGFAGSGDIEVESSDGQEKHTIEGAAMRILKIDKPRNFNVYYFVEKKKSLADELNMKIKKAFPNINSYVVSEDCNKKLIDLSKKFLRMPKGKGYKVLGFIDPKGMQLE